MKQVLTHIFLLTSTLLLSQEHNEHHIAIEPKDSVCLKDCIQQAHWEAHTRSFFMSTQNEGALKDDYALASGAGIGLLTKPLYGFQVGVSGFFMYNLKSSHIEKADVLTGLPNRYEIGLFDVQDPLNHHDLDRLEELYIKYHLSKSSIAVGKLNLSTPFINPQDGRMRPTVEEGVWVSVKESEKIGFNGGWLWEVSPRSTVKWFTLANSMGVYPTGVGVDGKKSGYAGNISGNSGIAIANIYFNGNKGFKLNVWNAFMENVMNTAMLEMNFEQKKERYKIYEGLMYVHQDAVNNGGNVNQALTYINKGAQSNVVSAQVGIKNKRFNTSLNYTHITGDGRYLMPREWGRDVFYTFMPRERNEGAGNVHAVMTKTTVFLLKGKLKTSIAYGYCKMPDVLDYRLNKYAMPTYHHINYEAAYSFSGFFKGLELKFLAAYKLNAGETYGQLKYVYNKVNMLNLNLVLDFKL